MAVKISLGGAKSTPVVGRSGNDGDQRPTSGGKARISSKIKKKNFNSKADSFSISEESETRMLFAKTMISSRPELLGIFDYFPLYEFQGDRGSSLASKLFELRVVLRAADMANIDSSFSSIVNSPSYSDAISAYNSSYASTLAEFSMLKVVYLMRNIADSSTSFSKFQSLYSMPEGIDTSAVGSTVQEFLKNQLKFNPNGVENYWDYSQISLHQLLYDLCFLTALGSPEMLNMHARKLELVDNQLILNTNFGISTASGPSQTSTPSSGAGGGLTAGSIGTKSAVGGVGRLDVDPSLACTLLSRDLSASLALSKIREDSGADPDLKKIIEKYLPENFISSSTVRKNDSVFKSIAGFDNWNQTRRDLDKFRKERQKKFVYLDQVPREHGLTSKLRDSKIMLSDSTSRTYPTKSGGNKSFQSMKNVVDSAFNLATGQLDFSEFKSITEDIYTNSMDLAIAYKSLYRVLDYKNVEEEGYTGISVVEAEPTTSPPSIFAVCLDVINRRFAEKIKSALYKEHKNESRHTDYIRTQAYIIIKDYPKYAEKILEFLIEDYLTGWLTAKAFPAEDEDTGELLPPEYFEPISGNSASLSSKSPRLSGIFADIRDNLVPKLSGVSLLNMQILPYDDWEGPDCLDYSEALGNNDPFLPNKALKGDRRFNSSWFATVTTNKYVTDTDGDGVGDLENPEPSTTESQRYFYSKIVVAEIIDCFLEIIRKIVDQIEEVDPVDGDPYFPEVSNIKSPYGSAAINFSDSRFLELDTEYWVPTLEKFIEFFLRDGDFTLINSGRGWHEFNNILVKCVNDILVNNFDYLKLVRTIYHKSGIEDAEDRQGGENEEGRGYFITRKAKVSVVQIMVQETDDLGAGGAYVPSATSSRFVDYTEYVDNCMRKLLESEKSDVGDFSYIRTGIDSFASEKLASFARYLSSHMFALYEEDQTMGVALDILQKYGERAEGYSKTVISSLDAEEGSGEVLDYIKSLSESGNMGVDILENINPQQLGLKMITLQRQFGNENESYVPYYSLMNDNVIEGIRILNQNKSLVGSEGLNVRTILVGLPSGLIDVYNLKNGLSIVVNNVDLEYNDIVFKSKFYNFDPSIYLMSTDLENSNISGVNSFKEFVKALDFSRIKFEINDGTTSEPTMSLDETDTSVKATDSNIDMFSNHAISFLLECYYRIMSGLELNEDSFLSEYGSLGLGISNSVSGLASALASVYSVIDDSGNAFGIDLSGITSDYAAAVENLVVEPGDFPEIAEEMMSQCRNALTSRLLSPEQMRDNILAAKLFDRCFMIMVDPDEFEIATRENTDSGEYTDFVIIKKYLEKKIIEQVGTDDEGNPIYKLAARPISDGRMAFNQFFVSVGKKVEDGDVQVEM